MNASFRVLIATRDEGLRLLLGKLLNVLRAEVFIADDEAAALARMATPDGIDAVIVDGGWEGISLAGLRQAARAVRPFMIVLAEEGRLGGVVSAFAAGADAALPKPPDPMAFLSTCRTAQHLARLERRLNVLERSVPAPASEKKEAEEPPKAEDQPDAAPEKEEAAAPTVIFAEDNAPAVALQIEQAATQVLVALGATASNIVAKEASGRPLSGDIVGWQGIFLPGLGVWYDILFHFTRPGAEYLCRMLTQRDAQDDEDLVRTVTAFLVSVQTVYRKLFEGGGGEVASSAAGTLLFCPPHAAARPAWLTEAGAPSHSRLIKLSRLFMVYDFHPVPGVLRIKPSANVEPGDVLNENIAASGQSRIPLASRGLVLTRKRLDHVLAQLDADRTLWVVEPSLLTRRLNHDAAA